VVVCGNITRVNHASYHILDNVIPCLLILSKSAPSLLRLPHALWIGICVSNVFPLLDLIMVYCTVCSLLMHRVSHHRQHQVIPPLPPLAGPPAPSYRWINEIRYGACIHAHHPIAIVLITAAAVRCALLPCVLAYVVMVYMTLMLCPRKTRLLSPVLVLGASLLIMCG